MWYCGVHPGPEQVGRIAPMIVVDMDRLRWDFCSCPACELAVERCERFDGLCRLADAYVEDTNRKVRQQYPDLNTRGVRVRIGKEYYAPRPAPAPHAWTKGRQFTPDPGGIDVVYDDRPVRHFRQRMQAVFEAT
jgi:hypothetical protein